MVNSHKIELEKRAKISQVLLPDWAESPAQFVQIMRKQLEMSRKMHLWIDLIFGFCQ